MQRLRCDADGRRLEMRKQIRQDRALASVARPGGFELVLGGQDLPPPPSAVELGGGDDPTRRQGQAAAEQRHAQRHTQHPRSAAIDAASTG